MENNKDKKTKSVLNALRCLEAYSQVEIGKFESLLKHPKQKQLLLKELQLPIKKGMIIKKIILTKIEFNVEFIKNCKDINSLQEIEKEVNLKAKKEDLIKKINKKKIPIQNQWLKEIMLSESLAVLNKVIDNLPMVIRLELGELRHSDSKSSSVIPIYTPMGNKR